MPLVTVLEWLSRHATTVLLSSIAVALVVPKIASVLYPMITPAVWLVLFLSILRLDWSQLVHQGRRWRALLASVAWVTAGSAVTLWLIALGAAQWVPVPAAITTALVLNAAAPPLMSSPAIALIVGLDAALILVVVTASTLVMPIVAPPLVTMLLGIDTGLDTLGLMARLASLILTATAAGVIVRRLLGAERIAAAASGINGLSVVFLVFFAIAMMNGITDRLLAEPWHVARIAAVSFAANVGLQAAGAAIFAGLARRDAFSIAFVSGNRAMALWVAVMPDVIHPDVFLYFAAGQIPIYALPAIMARAYGPRL